MNYFVRRERLAIVDGKLCREFFCQGKGAEMMVAKVFEDGSQTSRNLDYCGMFGWRYTEPGRRYTRYYQSFKAQVDEWGDYTPSLVNFCSRKLTEADKKIVLKAHPELKWILAKADISTSNLYKVIKNYKKDPRLCETLYSMGCSYLALNGALYNAKDKWEIVKWLSKNLDRKLENLEDIRLHLKGYDFETIHNYRGTTYRRQYVSIDEWLYLFDRPQGPAYFRDYIQMATKAGHDINDPYWHYPKDLKKAHDKVMKECHAIDELKKAEELKKKQAEYTAKVQKWLSKTFEDNGLKVFVQGDLTKWQEHADKLHQCIVANQYDDKVIKGECVLAFITKGGKPYATAELRPKGRKFKLGQFYGNEKLKDYKAKPDAVNVFNKWAKNFNVKIAA